MATCNRLRQADPSAYLLRELAEVKADKRRLQGQIRHLQHSREWWRTAARENRQLRAKVRALQRSRDGWKAQAHGWQYQWAEENKRWGRQIRSLRRSRDFWKAAARQEA
jgi:hypothetical protein